MSDYLEAELAPVQAVFPNTEVYLCDFHHQEQAWTRWCHDDKHGLTQINHALLEQLCPFARTPWANGDDPGKFYKPAVDDLKASMLWESTILLVSGY